MRPIRFLPVLAVTCAGVLPAAEPWTCVRQPGMPTPRANVRAVAVNGRIFAIGGAVFGDPHPLMGNRELDRLVTTVEIYDPEKETWTGTQPLPVAGAAGAAVIGDTLYVVAADSRRLFARRKGDDQWVSRCDLPLTLREPGVAPAGGKLYSAGGAPDGSMKSGVLLEYDPAADTWTRKADMPTHRHALSAAAIDGKFYAVGGVPGNTGNSAALEEYDPRTGHWAVRAPLPQAVAYASVLTWRGRLYVFGGARRDSIVQVYDPARDAWTVLRDVCPVEMAAAVVETGGKLYRLGGWKPARPPQLLSELWKCALVP